MAYGTVYWKLSNQIWQLCTLSMGKFFNMLKFDLSSLQNLLTAEACNFIHMFRLSKTYLDLGSDPIKINFLMSDFLTGSNQKA